MFSVRSCAFRVCSGGLRAILPESVHVILTMLRVLLCVFVCVSILLGYSACVRVCSAYTCAHFSSVNTTHSYNTIPMIYIYTYIYIYIYSCKHLISCICILIQTCYSLIAGPHTTNDTTNLGRSLNCLVDWPQFMHRALRCALEGVLRELLTGPLPAWFHFGAWWWWGRDLKSTRFLLCFVSA